MEIFRELDEYIDHDYPVDYWEDDASSYAKLLISRFTPNDWALLENSWRERSTQWRHYCAQILSWGVPERTVPLLLQMIESPDDELVIIAADSLRNMELSLVNSQITTSAVERMRQVRDKNLGISSIIINDLLSQCCPQPGH